MERWLLKLLAWDRPEDVRQPVLALREQSPGELWLWRIQMRQLLHQCSLHLLLLEQRMRLLRGCLRCELLRLLRNLKRECMRHCLQPQ